MSEQAALAERRPVPGGPRVRQRDVTLVELLDRLLEGGVAIHGEVTLAVADIDLVRVGLRLVVASVDALDREPDGPALEVSG